MKALTLWLTMICLLTAMGLAGGCAIDEIIKVDVPPNTRAHFQQTLATRVPPTITLRDARILRSEGDRQIQARIKAQLDDHAASNTALDQEIADGGLIESLLNSAINTGIDTAIPGLANVPGGAILTTLLAGVGGLFLPRPGEAKRQATRVKNAEDNGYDMGRQEAVELLRDPSWRTTHPPVSRSS